MGLVADFVRTQDLAADARRYLADHGCAHTAIHCADVAERAALLARRFGSDVAGATIAAWLHDISAVIPTERRLDAAAVLGVDILDEERLAPMILHQKLSAALAERMAGVHSPDILNAIRYHTTLHPDAGVLAKVVFVADKIAWDQPGAPPYLTSLLASLDRSLDAGVCVYLSYLWTRRAGLPVVHPWFAAAYTNLCAPRGGTP